MISRIRHCERSEAIQSFSVFPVKAGIWIAASAFGLRAMTLSTAIPAKAGTHKVCVNNAWTPVFSGVADNEFAVEAQKLVGISLKGSVG